MKTDYENWLVTIDNDQVVTLTLDKPDSSTNVLSQSVLIELQSILDELKTSSVSAVIFQSGKQNSFIAGADVNEFSLFQDKSNSYDAALHAIQTGQEVMNSIENLPFPSIALINGYCLGGGMELALSCNYRIALDHENSKLGLPEIKLGIHPGFGGTVRANNLLGVLKSMDLMLTGRVISVRSAKRIGLVDEVVAQRHFNKAARQCLQNIHSGKQITGQKKRPFYFSLLEMVFIRPLVAYILEHKVRKHINQAHYPAPFALLNLWKLYAGDKDLMMKKEAESVAALINSETAQNLIRVFHLQELLKNQGKITTADDHNINMPPQHIHVIGGGVMGGDIAIWCAYKGFTVTVHDKSNEVLSRLMQRANTFLKRKIKHRCLIQAALDRLIPDLKNNGLNKANLIIEAIIEDVSAKQHVFKEAELKANPDCIFATNTSSIPLDDISKVLQDPARLVGIHFFNPVARMPLIEVVTSTVTSDTVKNSAMTFSKAIGKLPLPVTSTPGFLVNRVLMPYLLEAIELYSEGIPAAFIDKAAKDFGMPMGPIALADKVGLDICLSVANNLAQYQNVKVPEILKEKVKNGYLGVKSSHGFYTYSKGRLVTQNLKYQGLSLSQVSNRLMFRLLNEAVACLDDKVIANEDFLDAGIIFGIGFAPFLGGPMHYIKHQGIAEMDHTLEDLSRDYGERFRPTIGWEHLMPMR